MPPRDEGAVSLYIVHELKGVDGKVKSKRKKLGHSFTQNFALFLYQKMGLRQVKFTNTSNSLMSQYIGPSNYTFAFGTTNSANSNVGLVVGTSSAAESVSDYNLGAKISHGTGSGQLQYSAATSSTPTTDATSTSFNITRVFTNGSAGSITVAEIGLIQYMGDYCLFARDLLSPSVAVGVGEQLTINYTIKVTI